MVLATPMLDAFEDSDPELNSTAGVNIANAFEKETLLDAFDSDSSQPDALPKTAMPNVRPRQAKPKAVRDAFLPAFVRSGPPAKTVGDHLADIQMIPNEKQKLRKRIARLAVSDNKRLRMHEETHSAIAGCWNHLKLSRNERLPVGSIRPTGNSWASAEFGGASVHGSLKAPLREFTRRSGQHVHM